MSIYKMWGLTKKPFQGNIFVTNQRVCFKVRMNPHLEMDLSVAEIKGFSVGKIALFTAVTIHCKSGENYPLTGFPAKKLQDWLPLGWRGNGARPVAQRRCPAAPAAGGYRNLLFLIEVIV